MRAASVRFGLIGVLVTLAVGVGPAVAAAANSDLGVQIADSADPATVGTAFTYSISVTNAGPDAATAVEIVDDVPSQVDAGAFTTSQGTCVRR